VGSIHVESKYYDRIAAREVVVEKLTNLIREFMDGRDWADNVHVPLYVPRYIQ
jgi:hypothetical protein